MVRLLGQAPVRLASAALSVTVLPDRGADILSLVDQRTGIDLLFRPPWGVRAAAATPAPTVEEWFDGYPGGWQLLLPNGGAATPAAGTTWGFHGEACQLPWTLEEWEPGNARLSVELRRAPLSIRRQLSVAGPLIRVTDEVTNLSPDPLEVMWGHHPVFGAPFLTAGCVLATGAGWVTADRLAPGSLLAAGSRHPWPHAKTVVGEPVDLSLLPGADQPRSCLAYLDGFGTRGWAAITNQRLPLGVLLAWDTEVFPYAWLWQEVHATAGYPWHRRAYAVGIEPASTVPAHGVGPARAAGDRLITLPPAGSRSATVEATVYHDRRPVQGVHDGAPVFGEIYD